MKTKTGRNILLLAILLVMSCKNKENITTAATNTDKTPVETTERTSTKNDIVKKSDLPEETQQIMDEKFSKLGFVKGTVTDYSSQNSSCSYMIVTTDKENNSLVLRPQNLAEEFKQNGLKVWIKYRPIKPYVVECKTGIPVYIEAIQAYE